MNWWLAQLITEAVIDTDGSLLRTNSFAYELGGEVSFATNALGAVTAKQYTSAGKPKFQRNPDGSTTSWLYYLDGRPSTNVLVNGSYWKFIYDDPNRITRRIFFTAGGTALATNVTVLDRRGNTSQTTDNEGNLSTN